MSQRVSISPDTVAELVELQNYVVECRDVTMYNLREQIRKTAEYVMFLMNHAHLSSKFPKSALISFTTPFQLSVEDINLNCRVFIWPKDMESVVELAIQRLNMKRDQAETFLRNKRVQFDAKLKKHEKMLVAFKKKDPAILTMEEMEENVALVENIVAKLEVRKCIMCPVPRKDLMLLRRRTRRKPSKSTKRNSSWTSTLRHS